MLLRLEMQFEKLHLPLSLAAIALLLRGCYTQEFLKAVERDPGIIGTNVALVCEYSPENIPFNYVQWTYSRLNDVNSRVKVYQYDRQGWAQSFEHLTGRSSHKHMHGVIQLDIVNTKSDDDGIYYCTYGGISPKTAHLTYTTISDATKCLQLDSRQERIVQAGNDVVIQASSICCKPPIRFLWDGVDSTVYSPCAVDTEPFLQSSTHFTKGNVQEDFEVTLTTKHPTGDMSVKYRVKAGPACSAAFSGAAIAVIAVPAVGFVFVSVLLYLYNKKKLCFNKAKGESNTPDESKLNKIKTTKKELSNTPDESKLNKIKTTKKELSNTPDESKLNKIKNPKKELSNIINEVLEGHKNITENIIKVVCDEPRTSSEKLLESTIKLTQELKKEGVKIDDKTKSAF